MGNAIADCQTPYDGVLKVALGCRWWRRVGGMQLQIARRRVMLGSKRCNGGLKMAVSRWWRRVMVGSRWQWVGDGGAVLLWNACNEKIKGAMGCRWRRVFGDCNYRLLDAAKRKVKRKYVLQ